MTTQTPETYLLASKELLLTIGQNRPDMTAEQQSNLQEAIEHIEKTRNLLTNEHE